MPCDLVVWSTRAIAGMTHPPFPARDADVSCPSDSAYVRQMGSRVGTLNYTWHLPSPSDSWSPTTRWAKGCGCPPWTLTAVRLQMAWSMCVHHMFHASRIKSVHQTPLSPERPAPPPPILVEGGPVYAVCRIIPFHH